LASAVLSNGINRLEVNFDEDDCSTLDRLLDLYGDSVNIPDGATIARNGETVDPESFSDTELEDGDVISATKTAGAKG